MKYYVEINDETIEVEITERGDKLAISIGGRELLVDVREINAPSLYSILIDNQSYELFIDAQGENYNVLVNDELFRLKVQDEWARRLANIQSRAHPAEGELQVKAPMPGAVVAVEVTPGEAVKRGKGLVILSAMKMENAIKAPRDGTVKSVEVAAGQTVQQGQTLVVLE